MLDMMLNRYEVPHRLYFRLAGESLATVIRWQQAIDLEVMRYQIDTFGSAIVLNRRENSTPNKSLQRLSELPPPGETIPWYGDTGRPTYAFTFRSNGTMIDPQEGSKLRVINEAGGSGINRFPPHKFPPLELEIPDRIRIEPTGSKVPSPHRFGPPWGWWCDRTSETGIDELVFEIGGHLWHRLGISGWLIVIAESYEYSFRPTSAGMDVVLYNNVTSEQIIQLTESFCW